MIDDIRAALIAATEPNGELDCRLYELLTGRLDEQVDREGHDRASARMHGYMLVDLGAERLVVRVPSYTARFEDALKLVPAHMSIRMSMNPAHIVKIERQVYGEGDTWGMSLWNPSDNAQVSTARHRTAALCLCLLMVEHARQPKASVSALTPAPIKETGL